MQDDASMRKKAALQELDAPRGEAGDTERTDAHAPAWASPCYPKRPKEEVPPWSTAGQKRQNLRQGSEKTSHAWSSGGGG